VRECYVQKLLLLPAKQKAQRAHSHGTVADKSMPPAVLEFSFRDESTAACSVKNNICQQSSSFCLLPVENFQGSLGLYTNMCHVCGELADLVVDLLVVCP